VNLKPEPGKVTVILGRNGVGKTTLAQSLMGLVPIKTGTIELDGKPIQNATPMSAPALASGLCRRGAKFLAG
jgi:urea transport system ATP-binding protein